MESSQIRKGLTVAAMAVTGLAGFACTTPAPGTTPTPTAVLTPATTVDELDAPACSAQMEITRVDGAVTHVEFTATTTGRQFWLWDTGSTANHPLIQSTTSWTPDTPVAHPTRVAILSTRFATTSCYSLWIFSPDGRITPG